MRYFLFACCLLFASTLALKASQQSRNHVPGFPSHPPTDCGGQPCDAVHRGFKAFVDRELPGLLTNGRACADCHMLTDSFQMSPAGVEARFQDLQRRREKNPAADDPLFRPIDADDFRVNGEQANDYSNLRENGLVRITLPLPPNIKLVDPVTGLVTEDKFVDIWRMVPTVNDVNTKPGATPEPSTGSTTISPRPEVSTYGACNENEPLSRL